MTDEQIHRLTRRRDPEAPSETWQIWYDGVRVGTIAKSAGLKPQWEWRCGFSTNGIDQGQRGGPVATYDAARKAFHAAAAGG